MFRGKRIETENNISIIVTKLRFDEIEIKFKAQ